MSLGHRGSGTDGNLGITGGLLGVFAASAIKPMAAAGKQFANTAFPACETLSFQFFLHQAYQRIAPHCELGWFCESTSASLQWLLSVMHRNSTGMIGTQVCRAQFLNKLSPLFAVSKVS